LVNDITGADRASREGSVVHTLRILGIPEDAISRAVEREDPEAAIFEAVVMLTMAERTVSSNDVEQRGGLTAAETEAFISAFGLRPPPRDELAFTPREAES
jgi:hypothetical protein